MAKAVGDLLSHAGAAFAIKVCFTHKAGILHDPIVFGKRFGGETTKLRDDSCGLVDRCLRSDDDTINENRLIITKSRLKALSTSLASIGSFQTYNRLPAG